MIVNLVMNFAPDGSDKYRWAKLAFFDVAKRPTEAIATDLKSSLAGGIYSGQPDWAPRQIYSIFTANDPK